MGAGVSQNWRNLSLGFRGLGFRILPNSRADPPKFGVLSSTAFKYCCFIDPSFFGGSFDPGALKFKAG